MRRAGRKKSILVDHPTKCVVMLFSKEHHDPVLAELKENKQLKRITQFTDQNNLIPMTIFRQGIMGRQASEDIFRRAVRYMCSGKADAIVAVNADAISYGIADFYRKLGIVRELGFHLYTVDEKELKLDLYQPPKAGDIH